MVLSEAASGPRLTVVPSPSPYNLPLRKCEYFIPTRRRISPIPSRMPCLPGISDSDSMYCHGCSGPARNLKGRPLSLNDSPGLSRSRPGGVCRPLGVPVTGRIFSNPRSNCQCGCSCTDLGRLLSWWRIVVGRNNARQVRLRRHSSVVRD